MITRMAQHTGALLLGVVLLASPLHATVHAQQTDQFTVSQQLVGADNEAPTVPTGLTATPVATTQIDLSWNASTDNIAVTGYQIFRDGVAIATTTLLTYSDTGLTASTTYGYTLRAFDAALNYSTSTATTSATTLSPPSVTPTTTVDGSGGPRVELEQEPAEILDLVITPGAVDALLTWKTSRHTQSIVRWGLTGSYELGSTQSAVYQKEHRTTILGLTPDTVYQFELRVIDAFGVTTVYTGKFRTLLPEDRTPPGNVRDLIAYQDGNDIVLEWDNPTDSDFRRVRILRSDRFYPSDPYDGHLIYEDDGEQHRDTGAAREPGIKYYTLFSYDHRGNVSSGAVVRVIIGDAVEPDRTSTSSIDIDIEDISFFQNNVALPVENGRVIIDGSEALIISIDYELLPEHLKTILVTIEDPDDSTKAFSFLLRINREKTRYEAIIAPLGRPGMFPITISVFDFKIQAIGMASGTLISEIAPEPQEVHWFTKLLLLLTSRPFFFWLLILILLLIARKLIKEYRGGRQREDTPTVQS